MSCLYRNNGWKNWKEQQKNLIVFIRYGIVLVVYILLSVSAVFFKRQNAIIHVLGIMVPIGWLLVATLFLIKRQRINLFSLFGQPRTVLLVVITAGALLGVILFALIGPDVNQRITAITFINYLIIILVVPVAEELFFRGLLLDHLKETMGIVASIAIITLLFGLVHVHQGLLIPMALLSFMLCIAALLSKTVVSCIILHTGWNTLAILKEGLHFQMKWLFSISAIVSVILFACLYLLIQRRAND